MASKFIEIFTAKDKLLHILVCAEIMLCFSCVTLAFTPKWYALPASALATLLIGVCKEIFDKKHSDKHVASVKDIIADVIGILLVFIPLIFI